LYVAIDLPFSQKELDNCDLSRRLPEYGKKNDDMV
jgi:hypothetical protein